MEAPSANRMISTRKYSPPLEGGEYVSCIMPQMISQLTINHGLWPHRSLDRSNLHGLHLLPIVRIQGFGAASGGFVGYSFLLRKFFQAGIFAGQLMRNSVGNVLVHDGTREVLQLRMRPALKILEAPLACIECIGSQPAGLIEWNA